MTIPREKSEIYELLFYIEVLRSEIAELKKRESPEQAFERGYKAGWLHSAEGTSQLPLSSSDSPLIKRFKDAKLG